MILKHSATKPFEVCPGLTRRVLVHGPNLMIVEFTIRAGTDLAVHTHPHEQAGYVASGRLRLNLDGKYHDLNAGDSYYVQPNISHGARVIEDAIILDAFTPPRQDFL